MGKFNKLVAVMMLCHSATFSFLQKIDGGVLMGLIEEQPKEYKQYWEVDGDGKLIENFFWDQESFQAAKDQGRIFAETTWEGGMYEPIYDIATQTWSEGKSLSFLLDLAKEAKRKEFDDACQQAILSGFNHEINGVNYHFSYDNEAQINFGDGAQVLNQDIVPELMWTVYNPSGGYERIAINKDLMNALTVTIILHKQGMISRYRDQLLPLIEAATTKEELEALAWEESI